MVHFVVDLPVRYYTAVDGCHVGPGEIEGGGVPSANEGDDARVVDENETFGGHPFGESIGVWGLLTVFRRPVGVMEIEVSGDDDGGGWESCSVEEIYRGVVIVVVQVDDKTPEVSSTYLESHDVAMLDEI